MAASAAQISTNTAHSHAATRRAASLLPATGCGSTPGASASRAMRLLPAGPRRRQEFKAHKPVAGRRPWTAARPSNSSRDSAVLLRRTRCRPSGSMRAGAGTAPQRRQTHTLYGSCPRVPEQAGGAVLRCSAQQGELSAAARQGAAPRQSAGTAAAGSPRHCRKARRARPSERARHASDSPACQLAPAQPERTLAVRAPRAAARGQAACGQGVHPGAPVMSRHSATSAIKPARPPPHSSAPASCTASEHSRRPGGTRRPAGGCRRAARRR